MDKETLLHKIMQTDFACIDLHLYLNTHPSDTDAIALYNKYGMEVKTLTQEYEKKIGPLSYAAPSNEKHFDWINMPWPWQIA